MRPPRVRPLTAARTRRAVSRHPAIEILEGRQLLAAFLVDNTADSGAGTLRQAILDANKAVNVSPASSDQIVFAIPSAGGQQTISLVTPLPTITDPLDIFANSQSGFVANKTTGGVDETETDVEVSTVRIDGSAIKRKAYPDANGLTIQALNCVVAGLSITGFSGAGIELLPGPNENSGAVGDWIFGNFIGVDAFDPNSSSFADPANNPLANGEGIVIGSSNNRIGGTLPDTRNVIQGNLDNGVLIQGDLGTGNRVEGDFVLDNAQDGILITTSNNFIGEAIGAGPAGGGDVISGNNRGVVISGLPTDPNALANNPAQGNVIVNSEIGTDVGRAGSKTPLRGMLPRPNTLDGVLIEDAPGNTVGGLVANTRNVISSNGLDGVSIQNVPTSNPNLPPGTPIVAPGNPNVLTRNADRNQVLNNFIGFNNRGGTIAYLPNRDGINISSSLNVIGGTTASAQNVIINNTRNGVTISGLYLDGNDNEGAPIPDAQPTGNLVEGNFIGTQGGADFFRNPLDGVLIDDASGNTIGGTTAGARNVISGNNNGITIRNPGATGNVVQGNDLGTEADGVTVLANSFNGVLIQDSPGNLVGGAAKGAGNVLSGNNRGIILDGAGTTGNRVQGNFIGTDRTGLIPVRNAIDGVLIADNASNNAVGGPDPADANTIADNFGAGVDVQSGTGNAILSNAVFDNHRLGIDLVGPADLPGGVTPNDSGGHSGPDNLQDFPVLSTATTDGSRIAVSGTLRGNTGATYTIQLFTSAQADPSGYGQGGTLLGSTNIMADPQGNVPIAIAFPSNVPGGAFVTATATDPAGNTSEFSLAIPIVTVSVQFQTPDARVNVTDGTASVVVTRTSSDPSGLAGGVTVDYTIGGGSAKNGVDYAGGSGTLTFLPGESAKAITVPILPDMQVGPDTTVNLTLSNPTGGATLGTPSAATLTIHNTNRTTVQLVASGFGVSESGGHATITLTRNTPLGTSTVGYATSAGTAAPGTDYFEAAGTVTFQPGQTTATFAIPVLDAGRSGGNRTVNLALTSADGAVVGPLNRAVLTIADDDQVGAITFGAPTFRAVGAGSAAVTLVRLGGLTGQVSVDYATSGGTATPGTDYTPVAGTVTFLPGQGSRTILVPIPANPPSGTARTVVLILANAAGGATLGPITSTTLTLLGQPGTMSDQPGPVVVGVQPVAGRKGITSLVVSFNEPLDPTRAQDLASYGYFLIAAGPDNAFGTADDSSFALRSASYDASTSRVTLTPTTPLPANSLYMLKINQLADPALQTGLTDTSGNLLEGSGSTHAGGVYVNVFGSASQHATVHKPQPHPRGHARVKIR